jgi:hypothetical protein
MKVWLERCLPSPEKFCQESSHGGWEQEGSPSVGNKRTILAFISFDMSNVLPICTKHT